MKLYSLHPLQHRLPPIYSITSADIGSNRKTMLGPHHETRVPLGDVNLIGLRVATLICLTLDDIQHVGSEYHGERD